MYQESTEANSENIDLYKERLTKFSQDFELGLFIHLAQRSLVWIILFFLAAFTCAFLYLRYSQPLYESSSVLQLKESNKASQLLELDMVKGNGGEDIMSDLEIIKSKENSLLFKAFKANSPFCASKTVLPELTSLQAFLNFNLSILSSSTKSIERDFI